MEVREFWAVCSECGLKSTVAWKEPQMLWVGEAELMYQQVLRQDLGNDPSEQIPPTALLKMCLCDACHHPREARDAERLRRLDGHRARCADLDRKVRDVAAAAQDFIDRSVADGPASRVFAEVEREARVFRGVGKRPLKNALTEWTRKVTAAADPRIVAPETLAPVATLEAEESRLDAEANELAEQAPLVPTTTEKMASVCAWRSDEFMNRRAIIMGVPVAPLADDEDVNPADRIWLPEYPSVPEVGLQIETSIEHRLREQHQAVRERLRRLTPPPAPPGPRKPGQETS